MKSSSSTISEVEPVKSWFRKRGWVSTALTVLALLANAGPALAQPTVADVRTKSDLDIAKEVAPYIYFHEHEHNWPDTIENTLWTASLVRRSDNSNFGPVLEEARLFQLLAENGLKSEDTYLNFDNYSYDGNRDLSKLTPYVRVINHQSGKTLIKDGQYFGYLDPYKEVQFWIYFPFNGCQTHRTTSFNPAVPWDTFTRHFQMCNAARHEGDVEAISILINYGNGKIHGVITTRHGTSVFTPWNMVSWSGVRAKIYSAWASHAMYTKAGVYTLDRDFAAASMTVCNVPEPFNPSFNTVSKWHLVDAPSSGNAHLADPTKYKNNIVLQTKDTGITRYKGRWGVMGMDNRGVAEPSELGKDQNNGKDIIPFVNDANFARCFAKLIGLTDDLGLLDRSTLVGNGTDWFSKTDWLNGMAIDKIGQ